MRLDIEIEMLTFLTFIIEKSMTLFIPNETFQFNEVFTLHINILLYIIFFFVICILFILSI